MFLLCTAFKLKQYRFCLWWVSRQTQNFYWQNKIWDGSYIRNGRSKVTAIFLPFIPYSCYYLSLCFELGPNNVIVGTYLMSHELKYIIETLYVRIVGTYMYKIWICNCSRLRLIVPTLDLKYIFMNLSKNRTHHLLYGNITLYKLWVCKHTMNIYIVCAVINNGKTKLYFLYKCV